MKIFEINWESQGEKEWVAAQTNIQALKFYCRLNDMLIDDFDDDDSIIEIPESKWDECTIQMEDASTITFRQWMETNKSPDIIAGTMYDV